MRKLTLIHAAALLLALALTCGCGKNGLTNKTNWTVSLGPGKDPYDLYITDQTLKQYFPEAKIQTIPQSFRYTNMDNEMMYPNGTTSLMILGGLDFYVSVKEWENLLTFARNGNEVLIFCSVLDSKVGHTLSCVKHYAGTEEYPLTDARSGAENKRSLTINGAPDQYFGYEGRSLKGYFTYIPFDTSSTDRNDTVKTPNETTFIDISDVSGPEVLGKHARYGANILRYRVGEGHITLHAAPLVLSNYFLLQPGNRKYLDALWGLFPQQMGNIYLNEYKKRDSEESNFSVLWRYPATKIALLLAIAAMILYVLFEGKRKQRIIPIIAPIKNDSVSFVETVGRLYYNKGNHGNLAEKMVQQFLEWVRMHYFLNTNLLNEHFIQQLTMKSGQTEATVRGLLDMIQEIKTGSTKIDDAYLYQLYNTIQQFYKNHRL